MSGHPVRNFLESQPGRSSALADLPDPDPDWAMAHPDRALALLFVSPRPCEALERLFTL